LNNKYFKRPNQEGGRSYEPGLRNSINEQREYQPDLQDLEDTGHDRKLKEATSESNTEMIAICCFLYQPSQRLMQTLIMEEFQTIGH
jgi:hypothetical protein